MAKITSRYDGQVDDSGKVNWRGDQVTVPQGSQSIYDSSDVQLADLGSRKVVGDRVFRYAKSADSNINAGELIGVTHFDAKAQTNTAGAAVVGAKTWTYWASTNIASDALAEGYIWVQKCTASHDGYMYRIRTHASIGSAATGVLYLYDTIVHTCSADCEVGVYQNLYASAVLCTNEGVAVIGVAPTHASSGDYFWLQTWGPAAVMQGSAGLAALGEPICAGSAGAAETTDGAGIWIGTLLTTAVADEASFCFLNIAP